MFVGPGDLSVSIDAIGPAGQKKLDKAIGAIVKATLKRGKAAGLFCARPEDVAAWSAKGVSFFILASDTMFLGAGAAGAIAAARG